MSHSLSETFKPVWSSELRVLSFGKILLLLKEPCCALSQGHFLKYFSKSLGDKSIERLTRMLVQEAPR